MDPLRITRLRRALLALCALATSWTLLILLTGGFIVELPFLTLTSRNPRNPLLIALITGLGAWALPIPDRRRAVRDAAERSAAIVRSIRGRWQLLQRRSPWLRWIDPAAVIALIGAGLIVVQWSGARPLWLDEQMIALNIRDRSLTGLAGPLWLGQSAPFGWLAVQRVVLVTLGSGELALRLVPVLFGVTTLIAAVWAGRRWMGPIGAATLVLLCAFGRWLSHYPLEVKHFSADAFWGLTIPVLAVWAIEADASARRMRRVVLWWTAAGIGLWFSNGAMLAAPACALILSSILWHRDGLRAAMTVALGGLVWLASFALHYHVTLRHAVSSEYLRSYWSAGLQPAGAGPTGTLIWLASRLEPVALNPAGTDQWGALWVCALGGFALARGTLGLVLASAPISAFALAAFGVVPLHERLALWVVPALYFGVALLIDRSLRLSRAAFDRRYWVRLALALIVAAGSMRVGLDIFARGREDIRLGRPLDSKQGLDDRSAVRWLMNQRQRGDVVVSTHLGLPAVWWYAGIRLSEDGAESRQADGSPILEAAYVEPGPGCERDQARAILQSEPRVLVYSGFPDLPQSFNQLVLDELGRLGSVRARCQFAGLSRAMVIDLRAPPDGEAPPRLDGCLLLQSARRW